MVTLSLLPFSIALVPAHPSEHTPPRHHRAVSSLTLAIRAERSSLQSRVVVHVRVRVGRGGRLEGGGGRGSGVEENPGHSDHAHARDEQFVVQEQPVSV